MRRVTALLKKDVRENWIIPLVILSIPLLFYFVPRVMSPEDITVGVCGELPPGFPFEANHYTIEDGISAVENGDIAAFYIPEERILYGNKSLQEQVEAVAWILSPESTIVEVPVNSVNPAHLALPLLLTIVILMGGLIGVPIVIGSEKSEKTLQALMLTPLTYREFIVEKSLFGFISIFLSSVVFLLISRALTGDLVGTVVLLVVGALLFSLIAVMLATPFATVESMMAVITPVLVVILFFESISMLNSYSFPLPISTGFYKSMILGEFPAVQLLVLLGCLCIILYITSKILRKQLRHE